MKTEAAFGEGVGWLQGGDEGVHRCGEVAGSGCGYKPNPGARHNSCSPTA